MQFFLRKLTHRRIWHRIFMERLTEPFHLNVISLFVYLFGSIRSKIAFDLIVRQPYAFGLLKAADEAKRRGFEVVSAIEFGVASGAGLMNMAEIAARITAATGVRFKIYGFDTGSGMPPAKDYRDHPEMYQRGDYPMAVAPLVSSLPPNVTLLLGEIQDTVGKFIVDLPVDEPIGFVSVDVDYYSSSIEALEVFRGTPTQYLPRTVVYLDDVTLDGHNSECGQLLAIREFNAANRMRPIEAHTFFENTRVFRRATWIKQIFFLHVLDHPERCVVAETDKKRVHENPYLPGIAARENFQVR